MDAANSRNAKSRSLLRGKILPDVDLFFRFEETAVETRTRILRQNATMWIAL